jgi:hypothetical protein
MARTNVPDLHQAYNCYCICTVYAVDLMFKSIDSDAALELFPTCERGDHTNSPSVRTHLRDQIITGDILRRNTSQTSIDRKNVGCRLAEYCY